MHCIIVVGGDPPDPRVTAYLPSDAFVIAADSGYDHAVVLGLDVGLVVGDLDSISAEGQRALDGAVPVERHPTDKDSTDGELALLAALARGATQVTVVSGGGTDRLDHLLTVVGMLGGPRLARHAVDGWVGTNHVCVLQGPATTTWQSETGETVSLIPLHGPACGVSIDGATWPLRHARLEPFGSLGISNLTVGGACTVSLDAGILLIIRPEALT